jgi:hypothetical protein
MISLNLPNVATIALISVLGYVAVKAGTKALGFAPSWL